MQPLSLHAPFTVGSVNFIYVLPVVQPHEHPDATSVIVAVCSIWYSLTNTWVFAHILFQKLHKNIAIAEGTSEKSAILKA